MVQASERTDWSSRLDNKGFHAIKVEGRPDLFVRWATATDPQPDPDEEGYLVGETIEVSENADFSGELFKVSVGDCVYLTGRDKGRPAEIHRVEELVQVADAKLAKVAAAKHGTFWVVGATFWRCERLKMPSDVDWHLKELMLSMKTDKGLNAIDVVENSPNDWLELQRVRVERCDDEKDFEDGPHKFFYRRLYWPKTGAYGPVDDGVGAAAHGPAPAPAGESEKSAAPSATAAAPDGTAEPAPKRAKPGEHKARIDALVAEVTELRAQVAELTAKVALQDELAARLRQIELLVDSLTK